MTRHTPAPWIYDRENPLNQGFDIAFPEDGGVLATAYYCEDGTGREVAEANARLITAAPDLLTACKAALAALPYPETSLEEALEQRLRAAIAKAEGR